jgi:hypothetical protein
MSFTQEKKTKHPDSALLPKILEPSHVHGFPKREAVF